MVLLTDLAKQLGLDRSNMRKIVIATGITPQKVRTPESKNQLTLAITEEEAEFVIQKREAEGFAKTDLAPVVNGHGEFYIIQVTPDDNPKRVKLGHASDVENRLRAHRTVAPTAVIIKSWPCKKTWEIAAIASISRTGCKALSNEVFDCDDLGALVKRADDFFDLMPKSRKVK